MSGLTACVEREPIEVEDQADPFAGLSPEEVAAREASLACSRAQIKAGQGRDTRELLRELRARRGL